MKRRRMENTNLIKCLTGKDGERLIMSKEDSRARTWLKRSILEALSIETCRELFVIL